MPQVIHAENLEWLRAQPDALVDFVYIDPPFNTGRKRTGLRTRSVQDAEGKHLGFHGLRYSNEELLGETFDDRFDDYLAFLGPRLVELHRVLKPEGSLMLHVDPRESHYCKVFLDHLFGRDHFQNELVWAYDYGARSKKRWSAKHDVILWYTRHRTRYTFDFEAMDRIPYMAPKLVTKEKAERGKTPTDVWWHTIVSTTGKERTGYPTQKPLGILERILKVHTAEGDLVLDCFGGSGTTGEAAAKLGRDFVLIDQSAEAIEVMRRRLANHLPAADGLERTREG